jgi:penicillin-binding protein 2
MSRPTRLTTAHQSITFSRRMLLLGTAQAGVGALLIGRAYKGRAATRTRG